MLWAISCVDNPNTAAIREKVLQPHRDYLQAQKAILVLAGATQTDDGKMTGFPMVGLVAAAAAVVSMVLAGRMRPAPAAEPAPETVEENVEEAALA